ncbi:BRO family protein [Proteiniphilum sp. UBA5384]|uniref:BRO family protein n=1 Tax=Proteiniphilum sp. UBA5384 TaxID=1947279 RepID=UPI0025D5CD32|nr:BRO family protein [Proteiniphilum sp. UBA5384]
MTKGNNIQLFEQKQVRTHWDGQEEKWYFSVSDVVQILSESTDVKQYIKKMRSRDTELNVNWGTICTPVVMIAADGKKRKIQAADTEGILRIIQSIPSKKAEPFKQWLAKVGRERIDEINDPEIGIDRLMETYLRKGYSVAWINQRLKSIEVRKELTDEWDKRGVKKGQEYAILTDEITKAWSGLSVKQYKVHKGLKKESLRDNMTNLELVLNMLAEATTTEISKEKKPKTFLQSKSIAKKGGTIAGNTRKEIESQTGKRIVTSLNAKAGLQDKTAQKQIEGEEE